MLVTTAAAATVLANTNFPLKAEESLWADSSCDSDSGSESTDSEVPRADYWECVRCKCKCTPLFRFCLKCFKLRKGYFPERPKRLHPRRRKRESTSKAPPLPLRVATATAPEAGGELQPEVVGPFASSSSSTISLPSVVVSLPSSSEGTSSYSKCDSGISLMGEGSSQSLPSGANDAKGGMLVADRGVGEDGSTSDLCHMCVERRRTGGFVHRKTVHVLCCYECSLRVWNTTKVCPMCNRRPQSVARLIYG